MNICALLGLNYLIRTGLTYAVGGNYIYKGETWPMDIYMKNWTLQSMFNGQQTRDEDKERPEKYVNY